MMDRRTVIAGSAGLAAASLAPRVAFANAPTNQRFVFVIQRGAADGLGILAPIGDPAYAPLRGALAEDLQDGTKLDGMFALHPSLVETAKLYQAKEALFAHAVASPYRERSHFDGQNVLESGGTDAYQLRDGWMNRLLGLLPKEQADAIAISATIPLALRGDREVASYAPSALPDASEDLMQRVTMLYRGDEQLHHLWEEALETRLLTSDLGGGGGQNAAATGELAARLLSPQEGARIAMIETGGWDTHGGQRGRMKTQLIGLDRLLASLREGLGPVWKDTLVVVATEFGRTAAVNGTGGTDHGTGAMAMLLGGAVQGSRVIADWPGLGQNALHEARDLKPTMDLDALIAGALAGHYRLDPAQAMRGLFPKSAGGKAVEGLIRT